MSTELAVAAERGQSMAELMGVSAGGGSSESTPSISRVGMIHQPVMGEVDFNGKTIKTEVLPIGTFTLKKGDDIIYSNGITLRIFAQRNQWQRWNSASEEMEKSVLSNSLNGDLKDSVGGFNLGRPSGYIEDFQALPDAMKQVIRSVKRVVVYFGTVTLDNPVDENGQPVSGDFTDVPIVMDVKNRDSLKSINGVLGSLKSKNLLPIMSTIKLSGVEDSIPTGATFGKISAALGDKVDISDHDNDTLRDFVELIEYMNGKVLDLHNERNDDALSTEDASMVKDIINNDFVDVDE
tara:strand:+ start:60 stop:941 length:882 start_codon:yes stop_codon:yes gene_type:complete